MTCSEFEHIAEQLRHRVLRVGLDFFGSREDAEDAAQETMMQLWRYLEHIDAGQNVEALAVRVAKNCCVSLYRRQQRDRLAPDPSHDGTDVSPHELMEAKDMQRMLSEALDLLKPRERQLFEMRQLEGLSTDEITKRTGIPKPSVTAMVSAARKKVFTELRRRMKQ